jgi:chromobox protein 1
VRLMRRLRGMLADKCRDGAVDVLKEYFEEIGGRPEPLTGGKRKGRAAGGKSESATPASTTKRIKQEKSWSPPTGSWEHDVDFIDTVEERLDPKTGKLGKFAYLVWTNEKKTQHPLHHVYQKCPQKVRPEFKVFLANLLTRRRCYNTTKVILSSHRMT